MEHQPLSLGLPTADPLAPGPEKSDCRAPGLPMRDAPEPTRPAKLWRPKRVVATRSALEWAHGRAILERCAAMGVNVVELPTDRLALAVPDDPRRAYA